MEGKTQNYFVENPETSLRIVFDYLCEQLGTCFHLAAQFSHFNFFLIFRCSFHQQLRIYGPQIYSRSITLNSLLTKMTKKPHSMNRGQSRDMQTPISLKTLKCIL